MIIRTHKKRRSSISPELLFVSFRSAPRIDVEQILDSFIIQLKPIARNGRIDCMMRERGFRTMRSTGRVMPVASNSYAASIVRETRFLFGRVMARELELLNAGFRFAIAIVVTSTHFSFAKIFATHRHHRHRSPNRPPFSFVPRRRSLNQTHLKQTCSGRAKPEIRATADWVTRSFWIVWKFRLSPSKKKNN